MIDNKLAIEEYRSMLSEEVAIASAANFSDPTSEFLSITSNLLIDAEEFEEFTECYFETNYGNAKVQIDGYSYDEVDNSMAIAICDYMQSSVDGSGFITSSVIENLYKRMRRFVECSYNSFIRKNCEESTQGYQFASYIGEIKDDIVKFRFYIFTDARISKRIKALKMEDVNGVPVEVNVWDISRMFDLYKSKMKKESIVISFDNYKCKGIPCVKAVDVHENGKSYFAYLAVVPGKILAELYIEYGSRLLEGNVRSFLSVRGKVNKGIRNTILNEPKMFFAYNNGLAATATDIKCELLEEGLYITEIKDFQIINGGQTTASIANAILHDSKKENVDLSNLFVPMKVSVVDHDTAEDIIPIIAECANTQNKVDKSDFKSNNPFHVRIEEYSRKLITPAVDGKQYGTIWFYERARGQYIQEQMKLSSKSQREQYQLKCPHTQVITKKDIAKYMNSLQMRPDLVSKGGETNMAFFQNHIDELWKKNEKEFNEFYYKKMVSIAIIYKMTDNLISKSEWYKVVRSYKANVVTYTLAVLVYYVETKLPGKTIDYMKIWNNQKIYSDLESQLQITTYEVYKFITSDRPIENVTEWCKKQLCWERAQLFDWTIQESFKSSLVDIEYLHEIRDQAKKNRKVENEVDLIMEVYNYGAVYWQHVNEWGIKRGLVAPMYSSLFSQIIKGNIPTEKQAKKVLEIRNRLIDEGMPSSF